MWTETEQIKAPNIRCRYLTTHQQIKNIISQTSEIDAIFSWEVNRGSELGTDDSFRPIPIPCVYRTKMPHASRQSPSRELSRNNGGIRT